MLESLTGDTPCPETLKLTDIAEKGALIVDDQAHVVAVGKLPKAKTIGDLTDTFIASSMLMLCSTTTICQSTVGCGRRQHL